MTEQTCENCAFNGRCQWQGVEVDGVPQNPCIEWAELSDECEPDDFQSCPRCGGEGVIVTCIDDICRAVGECIHGDGEMTCPVCDGEGYVYFEDEDDEEEDRENSGH